MRKIIVYGSNVEQERVREIVRKNKTLFDIRNVELVYKNSDIFFAELYGNDRKLKKTGKSPIDIAGFLEFIDRMPKSTEYFSNRETLLDKCGLPNNNSTSHCFNDETHHTCCLLGPEARKYADSSGNPIGITSENAFYSRYGRKVGENEKTSWCTCTGSKVCSYYSRKFNDGTGIKFIGDTDTLNEDEGIKKLRIRRHKTPGVNDYLV